MGAAGDRHRRLGLDKMHRVRLRRVAVDAPEVDGAAGTLAIDNVPLAERQFLGMINDVVFWPRLLIIDLEISPEESASVVDEAVATFFHRYAPHP